jgi:hypothetical protein
MIQDKIERLSDLILHGMNGGKRSYAVNLLNDIIDHINKEEVIINHMKTKSVNIPFKQFDTFLEKCVYTMQAIGLHITEIANYDDEALVFIAKHKHLYKEPMTAERLNNFLRLYRYFEWSEGRKPNNIKELADAYTEIKEARDEQL